MVWFPWSACQSVSGQDTEPQTAPDVLVGTLHGSYCTIIKQSMFTCIQKSISESYWILAPPWILTSTLNPESSKTNFVFIPPESPGSAHSCVLQSSSKASSNICLPVNDWLQVPVLWRHYSKTCKLFYLTLKRSLDWTDQIWSQSG